MQAVVFDMDGVLFDTERICMEAWREIGEEWQIDKDKLEQAVYGCIGLNRTDTRKFFENLFGEELSYDYFREKTSKRIEEKMAAGLPIMPGVKELLQYLEEKQVKIGLASSTRRELVLKYIRETELENYFQVVIGGDMIEHSKPLPDIYLLACRELSVAPEESFAIEDSLNGIRSGHAAGMKVIMVPDMVAPTPEAEEKSTIILDSLHKVKEWFEETNAF